MNILFISYWGINEGLTQATVIPHLEILSHYENIKNIILITIERNSINSTVELPTKSIHIPIKSKSQIFPIYGKFIDFIRIPRLIRRQCMLYKINKIIARGTPAGSLAYMVFQRTKIPFYVESFEPHADYMKDTGVWHKWGIKYQIQRYWEKQQLKLASGIVTVSNNYTEYLIKNNLRKKQLYTASCAVDIPLFKFNLENRLQIREKLGFSKDQVVCVYAGKFGGLYMDVSDLKFIGSLIHFFPNLGLIILTPENKKNILKELRKITNQNFKLIIKDVSHSEVPIYLSGADFALSINKSFASGKYLSPIKVGEYWANGLPILMTEGIGDESDYLEKENGGVLFNDHNLMTGLKSLQKILFESGHRTRISELAAKYRSFDSLIRTYEELIVKE